MRIDGWMDGRTDRLTDRYKKANSHLSQFCEGAKKFLICVHRVYLCVVLYMIRRRNSGFYLYGLTWLIFMTEMEYVYCAVRIRSLN
jgi:hypothetical protein